MTITTAFIAIFCFTPAIKNFYCAGYRVDENGNERCMAINQNGLIVYIVSYVVFFITYLTIACCQSVRRNFPGNMVSLEPTLFDLFFTSNSLTVQ